MRRTMARRHRRWLSGDFPPSRLSRRVPFSSSFSRFSLPAVYHLEERNGGTFPNGGKPPSRWTDVWAQWQEDVVRTIALCPNEGPLIFTSDDSKWSKPRKNGARMGKEKEKEKDGGADEREASRELTRQIGLWDPGNDSLLSIRFPICAIFILTRRYEKGCIFGIRSGVLVERFSLVTRFVAMVIFDVDKMEIGSAHLVKQMVKYFQQDLSRHTSLTLDTHKYM